MLNAETLVYLLRICSKAKSCHYLTIIMLLISPLSVNIFRSSASHSGFVSPTIICNPGGPRFSSFHIPNNLYPMWIPRAIFTGIVIVMDPPQGYQ
jgi:hypothetical protein